MAIKRGRFGYSFTVVRILQLLCSAAIVGFCALFAAEINRLSTPHQPAPVALALAVSIVAAIYAVVAVLWHVCGALPYIACVIADTITVVLLIATAALIGRPLTRLDCALVGNLNEHIGSLGDVLYSLGGSNSSSGVYRFIPNAEDKFQKVSGVSGLESVDGLDALGNTQDGVKSKIADYSQWVGRVGSTCREMKAVWGLTIILIFLFAATTLISYILYRRVYSIRTFYVEENDDGTHSYHTQHIPTTVVRELSVTGKGWDPLAMYDGRPSVEGGGRYQPMAIGKEAL